MAEARYAEATDAALAVAIARRDPEALEEVFRRHAGPMLTLALRLLRAPTLAEDTVQEVLLRLWSRPERFDAGRGSLRAFLLADVHGRGVDLIRANEARLRRQLEAASTREAVGDDPEEEVGQRLLGERVRHALAVLPPEQRAAIDLAYFQGRSYREVAGILGEPEGTVKSRIRLALDRLRGALDESEVGAG